MQLTPNFNLSEFLLSQTAMRHGIRNIPNERAMDELQRTAEVLERVRTACGHQAVFISSGYRSQDLNIAVGGSKNSAHCQGRAADFVIPGYGNPAQVCECIAGSRINFDTLIYEGSWVHLSIAPQNRPGNQKVLTARFESGTVRYLTGLVT